MRPVTAIASAIALSAALLGCGGSGQYPDRNPATKAKADAIRAQAKVDHDTVDSDLAESLNALDFRTNQVKEKARQEREASALKRDKDVQPLVARQQEARAEAAREKQRATDDDAKLTKDATPEQVEASRAEAKRRTETAAAKADETVADAAAGIAKADSAARQEKVEIDEREAKSLAEIETKRAEARNRARERRLEIDSKVASELEALQKDDRESATADAAR